MNTLVNTYISLLEDLGAKYGFSVLQGSVDLKLDWLLSGSPLLDKQLLTYFETGVYSESGVPAWLLPLWRVGCENPSATKDLRQLLMLAYKANVPYDTNTETAAYIQYTSTNNDMAAWNASFATSSPRLLNRARAHVHSVLYRSRFGDIIPNTGPGAIYPVSPKGVWTEWFETIEYVYPYSDFMHLYFDREHISRSADIPIRSMIKAKLISVPKDSRGPRLICVHPQESIWIQQGLRRELERCIERKRSSPGVWPRGYINFSDQTVNGQLALLSSSSRLHATLDLKEASDRLSEVLVQSLFGRYYKYFGCCRAQIIDIPYLNRLGVSYDHNINSYAPMGNATTFPVQALCFWAIGIAALESAGVHHPEIWVFGDDIITRAEHADLLIEGLESFGLIVNRRKTFIRGSFRESCGVDAREGIDVTPKRWRIGWNISSLEDLQSTCSLAMRLRIDGYESAATSLYQECHRYMRHLKLQLFLTNNKEHGGIAEYTVNTASVWRDAYWHSDYQMFVSPVYRLSEGDTPLGSDRRHLLNSLCALERGDIHTRPLDSVSRRVALARGWTYLS